MAEELEGRCAECGAWVGLGEDERRLRGHHRVGVGRCTGSWTMAAEIRVRRPKGSAAASAVPASAASASAAATADGDLAATVVFSRREKAVLAVILAVVVVLPVAWIARTVIHHRAVSAAVDMNCRAWERASRQEITGDDADKVWPDGFDEWGDGDQLRAFEGREKQCGYLRHGSSSEDSGPTTPAMTDCERRIYNITHSRLYTDEEENELIRAIRADPQCADM